MWPRYRNSEMSWDVCFRSWMINGHFECLRWIRISWIRQRCFPFLYGFMYLSLSSSSINSGLKGISDSRPLWTLLVAWGALQFSSLETNERSNTAYKLKLRPIWALSVLLNWRFKNNRMLFIHIFHCISYSCSPIMIEGSPPGSYSRYHIFRRIPPSWNRRKPSFSIGIPLDEALTEVCFGGQVDFPHLPVACAKPPTDPGRLCKLYAV